jgi:hypothetical protein
MSGHIAKPDEPGTCLDLVHLRPSRKGGGAAINALEPSRTLRTEGFFYFQPPEIGGGKNTTGRSRTGPVLRRMQVNRKFWICLMTAAALLLPAGGALAQGSGALEHALQWLPKQQQADGGFSTGFTPESDPGATAEAVIAAASGGVDPATWEMDGHSPLDYLQDAIAAKALSGPGQTGKVSLAVAAAGLDPHDFGGADLLAQIAVGFDPATGFFGTGPFDSALSILALTNGGEALPDGALSGLLSARLEDGSFAFNGDTTPGAGDSNTTALAVLALVAAGETQQLKPSLNYFRAVQNDDGGWTYQKPSSFGEATDANSTALVMLALDAAGEDLKAWGDPMQALTALQLTSGGFAYNAATPGENLLATVEAIPALAGIDYARLSEVHDGGSSVVPADSGIAFAVLILLGVVLIGALIFSRRLEKS